LKRKKPNYELKAKVIQSGLAKTQRQVSLTLYLKVKEDGIKYHTGEIVELKKPMDLNLAKEIQETQSLLHPNEWKEAENVNNASYRRTKRLKEKITNMLLTGSCIFLTLTFNDNCFNSTNEDTRKRYVKRYLKEISSCYIANIDYGSKNEREHYHALVLCDKVDGKRWRELCGNINFERVKITTDCETKMAKYINKLTNHAIKETTRRNCVIYSR